MKNDALVTFKNYNLLDEKQSCCQLKVLHINKIKNKKREFDNKQREIGNYYEVHTYQLHKQNSKIKTVNYTIKSFVHSFFP